MHDMDEKKIAEIVEDLDRHRKIVQMLCAVGAATVVPAEKVFVECINERNDIEEKQSGEAVFLLPKRVIDSIESGAGTVFFIEVSEASLKEAKTIYKEMERARKSRIISPGSVFPN